jgi:hypothetical protein
MKSKKERCDPDPGCGDAAPTYIAYNNTYPRDSIHFPQQYRCAGTVEMMKHLRAEDHVYAAVAERQSQRVSTHNVVIPAAVSVHERSRQVEADRRQSDTTLAGSFARGSGDVACSSTDIEQQR